MPTFPKNPSPVMHKPGAFTMNRANFDFGNGNGLTGLTGGKSSPLKIWPILAGIGKVAAVVGKAGVAVGTAVGKAGVAVGGAIKTGAQAVGTAVKTGAQAVGEAGKFVGKNVGKAGEFIGEKAKVIGQKVSKGAKDFAGKEGFVSDVIDNVEKFAEKNPRAYRGIKGGVSGIDESVKKHLEEQKNAIHATNSKRSFENMKFGNTTPLTRKKPSPLLGFDLMDPMGLGKMLKGHLAGQAKVNPGISERQGVGGPINRNKKSPLGNYKKGYYGV